MYCNRNVNINIKCSLYKLESILLKEDPRIYTGLMFSIDTYWESVEELIYLYTEVGQTTLRFAFIYYSFSEVVTVDMLHLRKPRIYDPLCSSTTFGRFNECFQK